ncbi:MAG: hypothetical protein M1817_000814 [Caeruleum heppii]|nr:MAG: hypothetical protein M1817_000814 [Caeruleum heppii]
MTHSAPRTTYRTAVLIYPGVDLLDFAAPLEVLFNASNTSASAATNGSIAASGSRPAYFDSSVVAVQKNVMCASPLHVVPQMSVKEATTKMADWDIVIVPGGIGVSSLIDTRTAQIKPDTQEQRDMKELVEFIRAYAASSAAKHDGEREKILMSICTGALLLGTAGVLDGMSCTTHHVLLDSLRRLCPTADVVEKKRWVDGGLLRQKASSTTTADDGKKRAVHLITAGGISSGLDATFYLVSLLCGERFVEEVGTAMEYEWRRNT